MALAIGFLLFLLGAVTFWGWMPETIYFVKGVVSFSLLFWGFVAMIVGLAERKSKRDFHKSQHDEIGEEDAAEDESAEVV